MLNSLIDLHPKLLFSLFDQLDYARLLETCHEFATCYRFMLQWLQIRSDKESPQMKRFFCAREASVSSVPELQVTLDYSNEPLQYKPLLCFKNFVILKQLTKVNIVVLNMRWCCTMFKYSGQVNIECQHWLLRPHGDGKVVFPSHIDPSLIIPSNVPKMGCTLLTKAEYIQDITMQARFKNGQIVQFIRASCNDWDMECPESYLRRVYFQKNIMSIMNRRLYRLSFDYNVISQMFTRTQYFSDDNKTVVELYNPLTLEPPKISEVPSVAFKNEQVRIAWLVITRWTTHVTIIFQ